MTRVTLVLLAILAATSFASENSSGIRLTISPARGTSAHLVGKPLEIACLVENVDRVPRIVNWQDHHEHHGHLPYPVSMFADVWGAAGAQVVKNGNSYSAWSTHFNPMAGDAITVRPGEKFVRHVMLDRMLPLALVAGQYRVQLRIPEATSNVLTIVVRDAGASTRVSEALAKPPAGENNPK